MDVFQIIVKIVMLQICVTMLLACDFNPNDSTLITINDSIVNTNINKNIQDSKDCYLIKNDIYKDKNGKVYFRLDNNVLLHPKFDHREKQPFIMRSSFLSNDGSKHINLSDIVDLETIRFISSYYLEDKNYIYVQPWLGTAGNYFAVYKKNRTKFLDENKRYLKTEKMIYYHGNFLPSLDYDSAQLVTMKDSDLNKNFSFIIDNEHLYIQEMQMHYDLQCHMEMGNTLKIKLLEKYFKQEYKNSDLCLKPQSEFIQKSKEFRDKQKDEIKNINTPALIRRPEDLYPKVVSCITGNIKNIANSLQSE